MRRHEYIEAVSLTHHCREENRDESIEEPATIEDGFSESKGESEKENDDGKPLEMTSFTPSVNASLSQ